MNMLVKHNEYLFMQGGAKCTSRWEDDTCIYGGYIFDIFIWLMFAVFALIY